MLWVPYENCPSSSCTLLGARRPYHSPYRARSTPAKTSSPGEIGTGFRMYTRERQTKQYDGYFTTPHNYLYSLLYSIPFPFLLPPTYPTGTLSDSLLLRLSPSLPLLSRVAISVPPRPDSTVPYLCRLLPLEQPRLLLILYLRPSLSLSLFIHLSTYPLTQNV